MSTAIITQVIEDMPIHKQLRKRVVNEDDAGIKPNAPQQQQPPPTEETSVISDDYSDRGSRKPAHTIGTKVKKVRDSWVVVFMYTRAGEHGASTKGPFYLFPSPL